MLGERTSEPQRETVGFDTAPLILESAAVFLTHLASDPPASPVCPLETIYTNPV